MTYDPNLDGHRQNRRKPVDELAWIIATYWVHNGDDEAPLVTSTDEEMARFILANYAMRQTT